MNFSRFFMNFEDFSWFFFLHFISVHHFAMIISCISRYYYNCFHIAPYLKVWTFHCCMHSLEIQCIQQWIQSIRQIVTCWTAYMRKRSKNKQAIKKTTRLFYSQNIILIILVSNQIRKKYSKSMNWCVFFQFYRILCSMPSLPFSLLTVQWPEWPKSFSCGSWVKCLRMIVL